MHAFQFPFKPYPSQLEVMKIIGNAINQDKIAIIESPTGTGKTLMLLCAILSHFKQNTKQKPSWMVKKKKTSKFSINYLKKLEFDEEIEVMLQTEYEDTGSRREYKPKLIYVTRTHSQIQSILKELKKTEFGKTIKVAVLGSRQQYCINGKLKNLNSLLQNEKCKDLIAEKHCDYFNDNLDYFIDEYQSKIWDIEDVIAKGKTSKFCPYFLAKGSVPEADIVIAPFQSIISEHTRQSNGIDLKNCVVVVDEAHSFYDAALQNDFVSIQFTEIAKILKCVNSYKTNYILRLGSKNLRNIELLQIALKNIITLSTNNSTESRSIAKILTDCSLENFNFLELVSNIERSRLGMKMMAGFKEEDIRISEFYNLSHLLQLLMNEDAFGYLTINNAITYTKLSAHDIVRDLYNGSKSLILIAGTLSPIDFYQKMMIEEQLEDKVVRHIAPHVVEKSNFRVQTIGKFQEKPLKFDSKQFDAVLILEITLNVLEKSPFSSGTLVFVPSFGMIFQLEQAYFKLSTDHKKNFKCQFESKMSSNVTEIMKTHKSNVSNGKAILFAVFGGKLSEGIDFTDNLARSLLIFGIPFPNMQETVFQKRCDSLGIKKPFEMGLSMAMRSVNQAVGRCLRHKNDYAYIFLVDSRYNIHLSNSYYNQQILQNLASWITPNLYHSRAMDLSDYLSFFQAKVVEQ
eukprot:NODE_106_length_19060_cov_0.700227.p1 type:complete len:684 gc:universal NODE_106_length_19060_cov_0.700227:2282-231(-)